MGILGCVSTRVDVSASFQLTQTDSYGASSGPGINVCPGWFGSGFAKNYFMGLPVPNLAKQVVHVWTVAQQPGFESSCGLIPVFSV